MFEEIGFIEEAYRRAVEPVILYPADPHPASIKGYAALQRRFPRTVLVPVFNEAILKGRKVREHYPFTRAATVPLQIPLLPPSLKVHAAKASFAEFTISFRSKCRSAMPSTCAPGPSACFSNSASSSYGC